MIQVYYFSKRKWKLIKWGSGFLSLYLDWRLRKQRRRRPLDIACIDFLMLHIVRQPTLEPFTKSRRESYVKTVTKTIYWHGSGRFQYDKHGNKTDVFLQVLKDGGMKPFEDTFDIKHGAMVSTSVARQRMYARIYADMHTYKGTNLCERYGSPRFWAYYFIMAINLHAVKELNLWSAKARRKQQAAWRKQGTETWTIKVTKNPGSSAGQFFDKGSDITSNYPILIGLKSANYKLLETADYVARYESRISSSIPMSALTHLEVPASKIEEVKHLLVRYGHNELPVYAFEQCEQLFASKHFSELVAQPSS